MEKKYMIFFAIPFDSVLMKTYKRISCNIRKKYEKKGVALTTVIGTDEMSPSPEYSEIASFKAQNRELMEQFRAKIRQADIVIADLTYNNPNVHVELGIALTHNKNILRVTGRSLTELGFDIRGLQVYIYKNEADLEKRIEDYLDTFFTIKDLSLSSEHGDLYWEGQKRELNPVECEGRGDPFIYEPIPFPNYMMRDGAVRVEFRTLHQYNTRDNWFGVYFRASYPILWASYLLLVRPSGRMELAVYPGPHTAITRETGKETTEKHAILIEFDNSRLNVEFDNEPYLQEQNILTRQSVGNVFVAAWNARIEIEHIEKICRDTIDWS